MKQTQTQTQYHDHKPGKDLFYDKVLFENFCRSIASENWSGALVLIQLAENIKDNLSIMKMKEALMEMVKVKLKSDNSNNS